MSADTGDRLALLGWTAARAREFEPFAGEGLTPGRVSLEHNHVFRVLIDAGEQLAEVSGRMKHRALDRRELPVVGDWVALRADPSGGRGRIEHVLARHALFSRRAAGRETEAQPVAANIDTVLVVFGLDKPVNHEAIERYLVVVRASGAEPVVVLNKRDLSADPDAALDEARAAAPDVPTLIVSARTGDGIGALVPYLSDARTLALVGPSGVGKSSIVNALVGAERLPTGEVRPWDARGRHTSVHRELVVRAEGGLIIDTPGMRELQLWESEGVRDAFLDVAELASDCRFRDCRHDREPGCAVKAAVDTGTLDARRYASFMKLQAEQAEADRSRLEREVIVRRRQSRAPGQAPGAADKPRNRPRR